MSSKNQTYYKGAYILYGRIVKAQGEILKEFSHLPMTERQIELMAEIEKNKQLLGQFAKDLTLLEIPKGAEPKDFTTAIKNN